MKSNFIIDAELLKSLNISVKQAIVLDFFYYYNNRSVKSYKMPITKIAEHLNIARTYLYKILTQLEKRKLVFKSCGSGEFAVSDEYKIQRSKCFRNSHKKSLKTSSDIIAKNTNKSNKNWQKNQKNNVSQDETKVSQKETESILYRYKDTNSSIINARVDIDLTCEQVKQEKSKIKDIFDLIGWFRAMVKEGKREHECFAIDKGFEKEINAALEKELKEASEIRFASLKDKLSDKEYEVFMEFIVKLAKTGVFALSENRKLMIDTINVILKQGGNVKKYIEYSLNTGALWIGDDRIGIKALNKFWEVLNTRIDEKRQGAIKHVWAKYKDSIEEFISYRNSKGRYFNSFAFKSFLQKLVEFESRNINVVSAINQSIERGYNWIFKPTHKPRFFSKKAKSAA